MWNRMRSRKPRAWIERIDPQQPGLRDLPGRLELPDVGGLALDHRQRTVGDRLRVGARGAAGPVRIARVVRHRQRFGRVELPDPRDPGNSSVSVTA